MTAKHSYKGEQERVRQPNNCATYTAQDDEEQVQGRAEERIAKAAEAATRSTAAAVLQKQQQHIPVKEDYFLPEDELGLGEAQPAYLASCLLKVDAPNNRRPAVHL